MSKGRSNLFKHTAGANNQLSNESGRDRGRCRSKPELMKGLCPEKIAWLRLLFGYGQAPLQWYDKENEVIKVGLPPQWADDVTLEAAMYQLRDAYDSLFANNKNGYSFVGFRSEKEKITFYNLADVFAKMIYQKSNGEFTIVNDLCLNDWHSTISG